MHRAHRLRRLVPGFVLLALAVAPLISAFSVPVHRRMTEDILGAMSAEISGQTATFSERALEQISDANEAVDDITSGSAALFSPERHFTNETFQKSTQRLIDLREEVLELVRRDVPDGNTARIRLGQALHTVQDFYSHSNWVELGNTGINSVFGTSTLANPAGTLQPCSDDPMTLDSGGGGGNSSAYYLGILGCNTAQLPAGKCFHGNYTASCVGINKDLDAAGAEDEGVAQSPFHDQAAAVAKDATRAYVQGILDELAGEDEALSALLDVRGSIGFVIDDSGSMGAEISGVRQIVTWIVQFLDAIPALTPDSWVLVTFSDPDVSPAFVTKSADDLRAKVQTVSAGGGGDCPEYAQRGLLTAVEAAFPDSRLFFFSDASSKDADLANLVIARAQEKSIAITYVLTGSCSPIDPAYIRGAEETGGQLFFLNPGEIPKLTGLIQPQLEGDLTPVAQHKGTLVSGATRTLTFPVDSTMRGLLVSVSADSKDAVRLRRPGGQVVAATDPDATVTELFTGSLIHVESPVPGAWQVEIEGEGGFTASIQGNSPLQFARFEFVKANEDIHGGFFPLPGQPVAGETQVGEATLFGPFNSAAFTLLDELGEPLQPVSLSRGFPRAAPDHFLGEISLPAVPFRVSVSGVDESGLPYQRLVPVVFRAQSVSVRVDGMQVFDVLPGQVVEVPFVVTSHGAAGTYALAVTDTRGYVSAVEPATLALEAGESATVQVTLSVAGDAVPGESSEITLSATRSDDARVFNSATASARVVAELTDADLSVSVADSPDPVHVGSELTYTFTVANQGPAAATGVSFTGNLPASVEILAAETAQPGGTCSVSGATVTCALGGLAAGTSTTVTVRVRPQQIGVLSATAAVSSEQSEPAGEDGDNAATASTAVLPALSPAEIPTAGEVGLALLAVLLGLGGLLVLRQAA